MLTVTVDVAPDMVTLAMVRLVPALNVDAPPVRARVPAPLRAPLVVSDPPVATVSVPATDRAPASTSASPLATVGESDTVNDAPLFTCTLLNAWKVVGAMLPETVTPEAPNRPASVPVPPPSTSVPPPP